MGRYSTTPQDPLKSVCARGDDLRVHFKNTRETARVLKGMTYNRAVTFLRNVMEKKECVPYVRFTGGIGRTGPG